MSEERKEREKKRAARAAISITIIAVAIVFATLLLTVWLVEDFNSLGDLFGFIGQQI